MGSINKYSVTSSPDWQILLLNEGGEEDLSAKLDQRLISLTLSDKSGIESDEITLLLDDSDNAIALPPTGAKLAVSIGWKGQPLIDKGLFTVDEMEYSGDPQQLSLRGRGAQVSQSLGVKKERSWHNTTFGAIAEKIAVDNMLFLAINMALHALPVAHEDQTSESDVNFLSRLAARFDAIATIKADHLLVMPAGQGKTVTGASLDPQTIHKTECQPNWRYQTNDKENYTAVRAYWHDPKASRRKSVLAGVKGREKALRDTYPNETEAKRAAKSELQRLHRGIATFSTSLAQGRPDIGPEIPITLQGWGKQEIDGDGWIVKEVSHTISDAGFTTSVELETV